MNGCFRGERYTKCSQIVIVGAFMSSSTLLFIFIGFVAQTVDGALGMAYGVISTSILLSVGVAPVTASACIHMAEVFTAIASGLSHLAFGNVDLRLFRRLVIPGILGAYCGATVMTHLPVAALRKGVAVYLVAVGVVIVWKGFRWRERIQVQGAKMSVLGFGGGFFDAVGGGGWGPMVSSTLLARGNMPRVVIGTVNLAEFFVAFTASMTFFFTLGGLEWEIILGLLTGGILASPLAAYFCTRISPKVLMLLVGTIIVVLSVRTAIFG